MVPPPSETSSGRTVVAPDLISEFERNFYYHGISGDPPKLLWRSDTAINPFRVQQAGERFFKVHPKTAHGVFGTKLNEVWDVVAPRILKSLKDHHLRYSAVQTARFSTLDEQTGEETFGPIVVWIAIPPNSATAAAVRDATPDILHILNNAHVFGATVEWYEGTLKRLAGPPLMRVEGKTSPISGLNHPFNVGLGIHIARASDDGQGTVALLFREVKTHDGEPSNRILALTNKHVATLDTSTHYDLDAANPQSILVCGERHFDRAFTAVEVALRTRLHETDDLIKEVSELTAGAGGQTTAQAIRRKQAALDDSYEYHASLKELSAQLDEKWRDTDNRKFAQVDWAPEISVRVDERTYTRDLATLVVDQEKLENFKGNIVDLGNQYTTVKLEDLFWSVDSIRKDKTIPFNRQLPIVRALSHRLILNATAEGPSGQPLYVVGKYGAATNLTLGNCSGMEAYTCSEYGLESREVAIYNRKGIDAFSHHGDSGALIFNGDGEGIGILHSGMYNGTKAHVTYATPLWWVIKLLLERYPFADFYGMEYTLD